MKTKFDIRTAGNMIGGRQGWAYICNSGKFAVLKADLDAPQEYDTYKTYSKARVVKTYKDGRTMPITATLAHDTKDNKNVWQMTSWGCGISSSFGYHDMEELIENATIPTMKQDEIVVVTTFSKIFKFAGLMLFKVKHVDIHCQTTAILEPLTDEEMYSVVADADRWCRR